MRRLIHVPIIHSFVDMGSLSESVRSAYIDRYGEEKWRKSQDDIAALWQVIETALDGLGLDYAKVRLYQDGLPVCGHEQAIVRDLAEKGGPNYRMLLALLSRGATIEGTEDANLLMQEYEFIRSTLPGTSDSASRSPAAPAEATRLEDLLRKRDRFMAARIDATLRVGETGILFLGALHRVIPILSPDIEVRSLIQV